MKIKCPHCRKQFEHTLDSLRKGGKNRWNGVTKAQRSAMARKAWATKRAKKAASTPTPNQNAKSKNPVAARPAPR